MKSLDKFGLAIRDLEIKVVTWRASIQLGRMVWFDKGVEGGGRFLGLTVISSTSFTSCRIRGRWRGGGWRGGMKIGS